MNLNDLVIPRSRTGGGRRRGGYVRLCRWLRRGRGSGSVAPPRAFLRRRGVEKDVGSDWERRVRSLRTLWRQARDEVAQQDVAPQDVAATGAAAATSGASAASRKVKRSRKPQVVAARPRARQRESERPPKRLAARVTPRTRCGQRSSAGRADDRWLAACMRTR